MGEMSESIIFQVQPGPNPSDIGPYFWRGPLRELRDTESNNTSISAIAERPRCAGVGYVTILVLNARFCNI